MREILGLIYIVLSLPVTGLTLEIARKEEEGKGGCWGGGGGEGGGAK